MDTGKDYSERVGDIVEWEGQKWVIDNTDDNFKDEEEGASLFLLPERYKDEDKLNELYRNGNPDSVGYWVKASVIFGGSK